MPKLKYPVQDEDRHLRQKIVFSMMEVEPPSFEGLDRLADPVVYKSVFEKKLGSQSVFGAGSRVAKSVGEAAITSSGVDTSTVKGIEEASKYSDEQVIIAMNDPLPLHSLCGSHDERFYNITIYYN